MRPITDINHKEILWKSVGESLELIHQGNNFIKEGWRILAPAMQELKSMYPGTTAFAVALVEHGYDFNKNDQAALIKMGGVIDKLDEGFDMTTSLSPQWFVINIEKIDEDFFEPTVTPVVSSSSREEVSDLPGEPSANAVIPEENQGEDFSKEVKQSSAEPENIKALRLYFKSMNDNRHFSGIIKKIAETSSLKVLLPLLIERMEAGVKFTSDGNTQGNIIDPRWFCGWVPAGPAKGLKLEFKKSKGKSEWKWYNAKTDKMEGPRSWLTEVLPKAQKLEELITQLPEGELNKDKARDLWNYEAQGHTRPKPVEEVFSDANVIVGTTLVWSDTKAYSYTHPEMITALWFITQLIPTYIEAGRNWKSIGIAIRWFSFGFVRIEPGLADALQRMGVSIGIFPSEVDEITGKLDMADLIKGPSIVAMKDELGIKHTK